MQALGPAQATGKAVRRLKAAGDPVGDGISAGDDGPVGTVIALIGGNAEERRPQGPAVAGTPPVEPGQRMIAHESQRAGDVDGARARASWVTSQRRSRAHVSC